MSFRTVGDQENIEKAHGKTTNGRVSRMGRGGLFERQLKKEKIVHQASAKDLPDAEKSGNLKKKKGERSTKEQPGKRSPPKGLPIKPRRGRGVKQGKKRGHAVSKIGTLGLPAREKKIKKRITRKRIGIPPEYRGKERWAIVGIDITSTGRPQRYN